MSASYRLTGNHYGLLLCAIGMTLLSFSVAVHFMLSFSDDKGLRVLLSALALVVTGYASIMFSVTESLSKYGFDGLKILALVSIFAVTPYEFHSWAGFMAEMNAVLEANSEYAQHEKALIAAEQQNAQMLKESIGNPQLIQNEISQLSSENKKLVSERRKCKLIDWVCRSAFNKQIEINEESIAAKNESLKNVSAFGKANEKLKRTINSVLMNEGDYNKAHPVFQKMSYALNGDKTKAMIYQGRALGCLAALMTFLEIVLPFFAKQLCFKVIAHSPVPVLPTGTDGERTRCNTSNETSPARRRESESTASPSPVTAQSQSPITAQQAKPVKKDIPIAKDIPVKFDDVVRPFIRREIKDSKPSVSLDKDTRLSLNKDSKDSRAVRKPIASNKGRGKSSIAVVIFEDAIKDGSYFKHEDSVGTHAFVRYSRHISPNGGIGKDTAGKYVQIIKDKGLPITKQEWELLNKNKEVA